MATMGSKRQGVGILETDSIVFQWQNEAKLFNASGNGNLYLEAESWNKWNPETGTPLHCSAYIGPFPGFLNINTFQQGQRSMYNILTCQHNVNTVHFNNVKLFLTCMLVTIPSRISLQWNYFQYSHLRSLFPKQYKEVGVFCFMVLHLITELKDLDFTALQQTFLV